MLINCRSDRAQQKGGLSYTSAERIQGRIFHSFYARLSDFVVSDRTQIFAYSSQVMATPGSTVAPMRLTLGWFRKKRNGRFCTTASPCFNQARTKASRVS